jgi:hypothetical protein
LYEELRRRKHRAAWWWLVGDLAYYMGLLIAVLSIAGATVSLIAGSLGRGWHLVFLSLMGFVAGAMVFGVGSWCKSHAHRLAERDGIAPG